MPTRPVVGTSTVVSVNRPVARRTTTFVAAGRFSNRDAGRDVPVVMSYTGVTVKCMPGQDDGAKMRQ
jgi:hypothetical protein